METTTLPILEQLESLRGLALDPNASLETVQSALQTMIETVRPKMDPRSLRTFLALVARRAAIEARIQRCHTARVAMFAQLIECEVETQV